MASSRRGHIRKRGKNSWQLKWELPRDSTTGKRQTRFKTVRGTKADANRELDRILHSIGAGDYVDPHKMTVLAYLLTWLDGVKHDVAPRTFERYSEIVHQRWLPAIGNLRLSQLDSVTIKRIETEWLDSGRSDESGGLSPRTVRHFHFALTGALDQAVKLRLLPRNPARDVGAPKPQETKISVLSPEQLSDLISAAEGTRLYIPILLAGTAGLRRGEVLALIWRNVDLDAGLIRVRQSLEMTKDGGLRLKPPKTRQGRRTINIPSITVTALREHATAQKRERLRRSGDYQANDLVCPNVNGGLWNPRNMSRAFKTFIEKVEVSSVTFHELRHTHITHLLQSGVHPKIASERAGHSSVSITLDVYSHAVPSMQKDAADRIDALIRGNKQK